MTTVRVHRVRDPLCGCTFGYFGTEVGRPGKFSEHFQIRAEGLRFDVPLLSDLTAVDFSLAREPGNMVSGKSEICRRLAREKIPAPVENYIRPFDRRHTGMHTLYMLSAADMPDMSRKMWRYARGLFRSERVLGSLPMMGRREASGRKLAVERVHRNGKK